MRFIVIAMLVLIAGGGVAFLMKSGQYSHELKGGSGKEEAAAVEKSDDGHKHGHGHGHGKHAEQPVEKGTSSLDVYSDGSRVHVLAGSGSPPKLEYSYSDDGVTWSAAVNVTAGFPTPVGLRRGNDARICAYKNQLIAIWSEKGTGFRGNGPFVTALSSDGGKSWVRGANPADDGSTGGHAFSAFAVDPDGVLHLAWLDSRNKRQGLRYANSRDFGKSWSANVTIDDETCECCWNTLVAPAANDVAVLYRDKNPRDMHLARSTDGGKTWTSADAGTFNWQFQGCPEVGAGLCGVKVENGFSYRSLVWTGETANRGLYVVSSVAPDKPVKLGPASASRPDMAQHASGTLAAVYSAMAGEQFSVYACTSADAGKTWSEPVVLSAKEAFANFPRVVPLQKGFLALWTESRDGGDAVWRWKTF